MILTKNIKINRKGNSKLKFYKKLGYDTDSSSFSIRIEHLPKGSSSLIDVKCDQCDKENSLSYKDYNRFNIFPTYICPNCKRKKTNLDKYGEEFVSRLESSKEKAKKTCLEKYGVENYTKTKEYLEKAKKTCLEKYGVENTFQSEYIKQKIRNTNLEKYGVEYYSKTGEYIEKVKKTSLKNWNFEHPSKSEEFKEKKRNTTLQKYGVDNAAKSLIVKEKIKKTFNEKWGGFTLCSDILIEKVKSTNLDKYGDENYNNPKKIKESLSKLNWNDIIYKRRQSIYKKYGVDHIKKSDFYRSNFKIVNDSNYIKYIEDGVSLFNCDCGGDHEFEINSGVYSDRKRYKLPLCTVCNPIGDSKSVKEKELHKFIKSVYSGEVIQSYRDSLEIDIYLPDLKLGFEFNGLYYHSSKFKQKDYHLNKTKYFKEKGIRIIHIWEDDWNNKRSILESQIKNWLGLTPNKIFARKCKVEEVKDSKIVTKFLEENHIQGTVGSSLKLGLYYKGGLVSLMTFDHYEGRKKMNLNEWNINRFCNKINTSVIGSASKLFKYFLKNYDVERVISYSDNDWSLGGLYKTLGFTEVSESEPDYKYIYEGNRVHKSRFRKSKTGISESKLNSLKVYDCGKTKWQINI